MAVTTSYLHSAINADPFKNWSFSGEPLVPDVAALPGGDFALAYLRADDSNSFLAVADEHATEFGPHQKVSQDDFFEGYLPRVATLGNGNLVVVWDDDGAPDVGVKARLFTAAGSSIGDELPVADGFDMRRPQIAALASGGFAVAFAVEDGNGQTDDMWVSRHDASGTLLDTTKVGTFATGGSQSHPSVAGLADGGYVVAYNGEDPFDPQLRATIFEADGTVRRQDFFLDAAGDFLQWQVVGLHNGSWAIVYTDSSWGDEDDGISMRIFDPSGAEITSGDPIHVNTPGSAFERFPVVDVLSNGFIAVTWIRQDGDPEHDLCARFFDQQGNAIAVAGQGAGDLVIAPASGEISVSSLAGLNDGRLIISWSFFDDVGIAGRISELSRASAGDDADDTITGDALRDSIDGGGGNDTLFGGGANDVLDGGAGDDTAVFAHRLEQYVVQDFRTKVLVTGPEGTDVLEGIEHLAFANGTLDVVDDGDPLFDTLYYLSRNPDVFAAGVDARQHYKEFGRHEGRDPNALFDTSGYLAVNKDVAAAGIDPLEHYRHDGWREGRDPSAGFDVRLYLAHNPDVAAAGVDPLQHYFEFGWVEGRGIHPAVGPANGDFDAQYYLFHNPDVAVSGVDARTHFNTFGWHEGRDPNAWFDTAGYLAHYADVAAAGVNPLAHYHQSGWKEGRDPSAGFDTLGYLAANPDVAAAGVDPLEHFLLYGVYEGRHAVDDGMWH